jgi:hypothetical protein
MMMAGQNINNAKRTEAEKTPLDVPIGRKRGALGKGIAMITDCYLACSRDLVK